MPDNTIKKWERDQEGGLSGRYPLHGAYIHIRESQLLDDKTIIKGVASSTSIDAYGTEMSLNALKSMAEQMQKGLPLLPRHNNGSRSVEWDEIIGRTVDAEIIRTDVVNPALKSEVGYELMVTSELYFDEALAKKLVHRLAKGESIGQSIGGWFTSVRVDGDEEDDTERVIIEAVELDHLAITRAPANPDSNMLHQVRSTILDFIAEERNVIELGTFPTAPEDTEWSFSVEDQNEILGDPPDWGLYKKVHVYYDPEKAETKDGYKLPVATIVDGSIKVVWRGVYSAMAALNGARGGVDIPDDERTIVYDRLKEYYVLFDKEPPELVEYDAQEETDMTEPNPVEQDMLDASDTPAENAESAEEIPTESVKVTEKANYEALVVGTFVRFYDPSTDNSELVGYVEAVKTEGEILGYGIASVKSPLLEVCVYVPLEDGYVASHRHVWVFGSLVDVIDPLSAPSGNPELPDTTDSADSAEYIEETAELSTLQSAETSVTLNQKSKNHGEIDMDKKELAEIVSIAITEAFRVRDTTPKAELPTPVPVAVAPVTSERELELVKKVEELQRTVSAISLQPQRRGRTYVSDVMDTKNDFDRELDSSREEAPNLCNVLEANRSLLTREKPASRGEIIDLLSAGIRAAEADGLIGNTSQSSWK